MTISSYLYDTREPVVSKVIDTSDLAEALGEPAIEAMLNELFGTADEVPTPTLSSKLPVEGRATLRAKPAKGGSLKKATPAEAMPDPSGSLDDESRPELKVTVVEAEALEGEEKYLRPNGDYYFARKWGDHIDIEVLRKAREAGQYVMLYGVPGTGKTALVEGAFPEELYTLLGSGDTEVADLVGSYVQTPSGKFEWVDGVLTRAAEEGKVLLIDEIGLIDPKVLTVVYGLMDGRKELPITANPERGTVKAKEGFYVVSATNPNVAGVRLSEALLSRFTIQAEMTTDWGLAKKLGVPAEAVVASQNLSRKLESGEVGWAPQFRELLAFRDVTDLFGTRFAIQNLLAGCPEIDRPIASNVFGQVFGEELLPAKI